MSLAIVPKLPAYVKASNITTLMSITHFLGSVSKQIINFADCTVTVVH